ncbi:MAG: hypothetical protein IJW24_02595 [Clostridia bacterium]|nr:hypothetical protein [Clostridia bacterium]
MIKLEQISLPIKFTDEIVKDKIAEKLKIKAKSIKHFEILKLSVDARRKPNIKFIASIGAELEDCLEDRFENLKFEKNVKFLEYPKTTSKKKFLVVGFGPSGMFASLALARMGFDVIVAEQGKMVDEREKDVHEFWHNRNLNPFSNVQFGEGGAGTFSDGKLNTNLNNEYCKIVTNEFLRFGAPEEIGYLAKPHIGSDRLKKVVKNMREHIKSLGAKFMFSTKLVDVVVKNGAICGAKLQNVLNNETFDECVDGILLCVGHSARDTFRMLFDHGAKITQKPFAMGVRIEQKQKDINLTQYGAEQIEGLGNADYKLVEHLPNGRSIFTFCMCPGGEVVASSSSDGEIVTNGMSNFARDKENANSAVLVNILPSDYESSHPLAGIDFQSKYEKLAFELGGGNFDAPAESVGSFVSGKNVEPNINASYRPNVKFCKIQECLPEIVSQSLKIGLPLLNKKLKNFAKDENLLIAIESRSSSPITIVRDENMMSNIKGLFPVGEGAGFAGGIMSSAQDGIKVAEAIFRMNKE